MDKVPFFEIHIPKTMSFLKEGKKVTDFSEVYEFCDFIDKREDCNDFRMVAIQRLYLQFASCLPEKVKNRIKKTILNFRYWMKEPGSDNMCYWSENHQLLFAASEYVACKLFPDETFTNVNKTGSEKIDYAYNRILHWLKMRFNTGFIEWHSHVYYAEDLAALMHLIDFSDNQELESKATIISDLMFLDMAMHSYKGNFALTHGRSYEMQKKSSAKADIAPIVSEAFKLTDIAYDQSRIAAVFSYRKKYKVPEIIIMIAHDVEEVIVKDQMGFDLRTIKRELDLKDELDRFALWQMEAFTNPQIINHSIDMLNEYNLYTNKFLSDFKSISHPLLRKTGLLPIISRIIKPVTDGVAIQQANTYTYKTKDFSMSTAQSHYPGTPGDQQHIMNVCLGEEFNVFITHPAVLPYDEDNAYLSLSPNNWVGNGRMPHSVQDKAINITIFKIPKRKAFMEKVLNNYTHAYFPIKHFDNYDIEENIAFCQVKNALLALIGRRNLLLKNDEELIQEGRFTTWVTELSSIDQESYEDFKTRIKTNRREITDNKVFYCSKGNDYLLKYKKAFFINKKPVNTKYKRFETPYIESERYQQELVCKFKNQKIIWNLDKMIRKEGKNGKQ
jgi:hypothetical protein